MLPALHWGQLVMGGLVGLVIGVPLGFWMRTLCRWSGDGFPPERGHRQQDEPPREDMAVVA